MGRGQVSAEGEDQSRDQRRAEASSGLGTPSRPVIASLLVLKPLTEPRRGDRASSPTRMQPIACARAQRPGFTGTVERGYLRFGGPAHLRRWGGGMRHIPSPGRQACRAQRAPESRDPGRTLGAGVGGKRQASNPRFTCCFHRPSGARRTALAAPQVGPRIGALAVEAPPAPALVSSSVTTKPAPAPADGPARTSSECGRCMDRGSGRPRPCRGAVAAAVRRCRAGTPCLCLAQP